MTTKTRILYYLHNRGWVSGSELEKQADNWVTKSSVISRRCRDLVGENKIERSLSDRKTVQYRLYKPVMSSFQANSYLQSLDKELERERNVSLL